MIVRPGKKEDSHAIATYISMAESEMIEFFAGSADRDKILDALETFILHPEPNRYSLSTNLVLEEDGNVVGSVISFAADSQDELDKPVLASLRERGVNLDRLTREGAPGTWYLSTMGVNPDYRGRGVGTMLLKAAAEYGRKQGFQTMSLLVSPGKPRAKALYERLGFKVTEPVQIADHHYERMIVEAATLA